MTEKAAPAPSRRAVIRGVAVGGVTVPLLGACGGEETGGTTPPTSGVEVRVATSDVPVGGGTIVVDDTEQVFVVTQPARGDFKAFSGICTHQKCPVSQVKDGQIVCTCHGSHYSVDDGSVTSGPAPAPLREVTATVSGDEVVVTG